MRCPLLSLIDHEMPYLASIDDEMPLLSLIDDEMPSLAPIDHEMPSLPSIDHEMPPAIPHRSSNALSSFYRSWDALSSLYGPTSTLRCRSCEAVRLLSVTILVHLTSLYKYIDMALLSQKSHLIYLPKSARLPLGLMCVGFQRSAILALLAVLLWPRLNARPLCTQTQSLLPIKWKSDSLHQITQTT